MIISQITAGKAPDAAARTPASEAADSQFTAVMTEIAAARPTKQMSLEEYAQYIRDAIDEIPVSPSRALSCISVTITPEGLKAMQEDPEYEKWVLDGLAADFSATDPWAAICGGHYTVHKIGATKAEYVGQSWYPEYGGGKGTAMYDRQSSGCLWKKSGALSKKDSDLYEKMRARLRLETYLKKIALQHSQLQTEMLEQASKNRQATEAMDRSGQKPVVTHTPVEFHGVPASELLSLLGGGFF